MANVRSVPAMLARHGPLRVDEETASETIWALASPETYLLFSEQRGWSRERYAAWLAESLIALIAGPELPAVAVDDLG